MGCHTVTSSCPSFSCSPFNDRPMCRICHEGSSQEDLLSPCECTGTLGTIHRSCLEHWLSSSNTSYCELCHFRFAVERKPRPLVEVSKWSASWKLRCHEQMTPDSMPRHKPCRASPKHSNGFEREGSRGGGRAGGTQTLRRTAYYLILDPTAEEGPPQG